MYSIHSILLIVFILFGCQSKKSIETPLHRKIKERSFPEAVNEVFEAHGGYGSWSNLQSMKFDLSKGEKYQIDLHSRNVSIQSDSWTIGSKGEQVWLSPDTVAFSELRFYHSLYYYFAAMPFILGDSGIVYQAAADQVFRDTTYAAIKISFQEGIGEAPKDNYFICYDKKTKVMKWLMYTVTFGEDVVNEDYGLINYANWQKVNGLLMPKRLVWYKYNDGIDIARRSEASILNWQLSAKPLDTVLFTAPKNARFAD
jgi:hypothetical protein